MKWTREIRKELPHWRTPCISCPCPLPTNTTHPHPSPEDVTRKPDVSSASSSTGEVQKPDKGGGTHDSGIAGEQDGEEGVMGQERALRIERVKNIRGRLKDCRVPVTGQVEPAFPKLIGRLYALRVTVQSCYGGMGFGVSLCLLLGLVRVMHFHGSVNRSLPSAGIAGVARVSPCARMC